MTKQALHSTSPRLFSLLLPLIALLTHAAFVYGQLAVMWRLVFEVVFQGELEATTWDSKLFFSLVGLENPYVINTTQIQPLQNFTYLNAIEKLWQAKDLSNKVVPRFGAVLLILFSGFWPHVKLILLQIYYFLPGSSHARRKGLYWASTFGKYSLVDVFVVCVLISVCNLTMPLYPELILQRAKDMTPRMVDIIEKSVSVYEAEEEICNTLLGLNCTILSPAPTVEPHKILSDLGASCRICKTVTQQFYKDPGLLTNFAEEILNGLKFTGGGQAHLRVAGLAGLHVFCLSVLVSLILGVFIDGLNHRTRSRIVEKSSTQGESSLEEALLTDESELGEADEIETLLSLDNTYRSFSFRIGLQGKKLFIYYFICCFCIALFALTLLTYHLKSLHRKVPGSIPKVINETFSFEFKKDYSFWELVQAIGGKFFSHLLLYFLYRTRWLGCLSEVSIWFFLHYWAIDTPCLDHCTGKSVFVFHSSCL